MPEPDEKNLIVYCKRRLMNYKHSITVLIFPTGGVCSGIWNLHLLAEKVGRWKQQIYSDPETCFYSVGEVCNDSCAQLHQTSHHR